MGFVQIAQIFSFSFLDSISDFEFLIANIVGFQKQISVSGVRSRERPYRGPPFAHAPARMARGGGDAAERGAVGRGQHGAGRPGASCEDGARWRRTL